MATISEQFRSLQTKVDSIQEIVNRQILSANFMPQDALDQIAEVLTHE